MDTVRGKSFLDGRQTIPIARKTIMTSHGFFNAESAVASSKAKRKHKDIAI